LHGNERENTQHITVSYLTDEKKKIKRRESEPLDKQHDAKDTENGSSTRLSSDRSVKSTHSLLRIFHGKSTQAKTDKIEERYLDGSPAHLAANALSVTARWGLDWPSQSTTSQSVIHATESASTDTVPCDCNTTANHNNNFANKVANVFKKRGKRDRKNADAAKLHKSLDASVLREALVRQRAKPNNRDVNHDEANNRTDFAGLNATASDQDLSQAHPDVPPLDLQSHFGSQMSHLKLVCFSLFSIHSSCIYSPVNNLVY